MRQLIREGKSTSKALQAQIDTAVALADREIGIRGEGPLTRPPMAATLIVLRRVPKAPATLVMQRTLCVGLDKRRLPR